MITKNGVCYVLEKSPYRLTLNNITFVFSSQLHLDKFKDRHKENREIVAYSLTKRFNFPVNVDVLADVVLYRKIETRGFLLLNKEGNELCQKSLQFAGLSAIMKN